MASTKEIKDRISSVKDTQKITNAMYMIASTKMRKARQEYDDTVPYFRYLREEIKRIFRACDDELESPYFFDLGKNEEETECACLVVTADKGLAGAYNQTVIKTALEFLSKHKDTKLYVVGEYGRHYFTRHNIPIEKSFLYTAQNPTIGRARHIATTLLTEFDNGSFGRVYVIYTDMEGSQGSDAKVVRLLPFAKDYFKEDAELKDTTDDEHFEFYPDEITVLNQVVPSYLSGYIYSTLVASFTSEQSARMAAMEAANGNAQELLSQLSVTYNRARQAAITQEITEVSSGARAQKKKKRKESLD